MTSSSAPGAQLVAALERWQAHGGTWHVAHRTPATVTVAMCRCDGGEEVERFTSGAPEVLDYVTSRDAPTPPGP